MDWRGRKSEMVASQKLKVGIKFGSRKRILFFDLKFMHFLVNLVLEVVRKKNRLKFIAKCANRSGFMPLVTNMSWPKCQK